jgi:hypothetical protein
LKVLLERPSLLELTVLQALMQLLELTELLRQGALVLPAEPLQVQACPSGVRGVLVAMGAGYVHLGQRQFRTLMQSVEREEQHASPLTAWFRLDLEELL